MSGIDSITETLWPTHEAERSYIAALLASDDANLTLHQSRIEPIHMESGSYGSILDAMIAVRDRGEHVDHITVAEQLANPEHEAAMWDATNRWVNPGFVTHYADQIMARWRRRNYSDLGTTISTAAQTVPGSELDTKVEQAVEQVLSQPSISQPVRTDATLAERLFGQRDDEQGVPTPWPRLNKAIKGFRKGQIYTLSGDTGSGKSALALQMAYALAHAGTCLYFTMEMSEGEMQDRLTAQQVGVTLDMVERQHFPAGPIRDRVERWSSSAVPITFVEDQTVNASEVRRVALGTPNLSGIVLDQLALMDLGASKGENKADVIARTTSALKRTAAALQVPIILVSQLNREAFRSGRPTRHHLYGSSAVANDAGVILIIHREDLSAPECMTVIVDKNRFGEPGQFDLDWQGDMVRAMDPSS
jgi:replicative DNA helicase